MKLVNSAQMRELDMRTIRDYGIPGEVLMERAGRGVADTVRMVAETARLANASVVCFAGGGNNGGDAFVAARYLSERGFNVEVRLAGSTERIRGDSLIHMRKMIRAGVPLTELTAEQDWDKVAGEWIDCDIAVDGIIGTGINGPVRGIAARAISCVNALADRSMIVAIDVPSGLNADTGNAAGETVRADITVTMGLPKRGFVEPQAMEYVGSVEVINIGIPVELVDGIDSTLELIVAAGLKRLFHRRPCAAHKGLFGHVLIIGGAAGYSGAITMAARAAVRSGAGLVTVLVPRSIATTVACGVQEAMVHGVEETDVGSLSSKLWSKWHGHIESFNAILMGPGMRNHEQSQILVADILRTSNVPLILDADALNAQSNEDALLQRATCPVLITPHPGELSRFLGCDTATVQADRVKTAITTATATGATVILKGAGTIVAAENRSTSINLSGNPGMATGGMGDVLAGLLTGFVAQGIEPFDAACAAVYLHGLAGDRVAWRYSQAGLAAGDVIEELPRVMRKVSAR